MILPMLGQSDQTALSGDVMSIISGMTGLLSGYAYIFIIAFVVSLVITPFVRKLAFRIDAVDRPDFERKEHSKPVAYMGGVAVFFGLMAAIAASYFLSWSAPVSHEGVPFAIIVGMVAITFTGFSDDVWGWDPRLKIAGQLVAAAALAIEEVGVKVASGVILPLARAFNESLTAQDLIFHIPIGSGTLSIDLVYWVGTAIIAIFVLGGCNAANLIDGLDGLLSGVTAIVALGLLLISLLMAVVYAPDLSSPEETTLAGARIVLCLAVLGAVLGFLPYNFNPASIFLGDSGSLLLGYCSVVVILMLGDEGLTYLVCCGLIIFSIPIIDTVLAITRRKMAGMDISGADDQHLHHKLKRALGGVKRAVWAIYGMGVILTVFGVGLAAVVMLTPWRARLIYITTTILYAGVVIIALILARRQAQTKKKPIIASDASSPPSSGD